MFLRRVVLVTVPLPWPKPATNHPSITSAAAAVADSSLQTRLFASEPTTDEIAVEVYERHGERAHLYRWTLASEAAIPELVAAIAGTADGDLSQVAVHATTLVDVDDELAPTFLICTQGSHDMCCGTSGVALADEIESQRPDYHVRRVSHTGGHRFSPTLLSFPEGRMWAYADLALVDRIATGATTADDHRQHARGWWGARVGQAQVAECAVRAEVAGEPFIEPVISPVDDATAASPKTFDVSVGDRSWRVAVRVERTIPTIACEAPGGLPVKPGREFGWSIEQR